MKWLSGVVAASQILACGDDRLTLDASPARDAMPARDARLADASSIDAPPPDAFACENTFGNPWWSCPTPVPGKVSLCGLVFDAELTTSVEMPGADGSACDPAQPTQMGPCSLSVIAYDAQEYVADPATAIPLAAGANTIDTCGHYVVRDVAPPASGLAAVVVDDHPALDNARVPTLIVRPALPDQAGIGPPAYTTRLTSEQGWSTSAALTPGFAQRGAILLGMMGSDFGAVQVLRNGHLIPNDDFYFSDVSIQRTTIDRTRTWTGPNGAALVIGGRSWDSYSGMGGGCPIWNSTTAATLPGRIYVTSVGPRICP